MSNPWRVHAERPLYASPWVAVHLADVEKPTGTRHPHHVVRVPHEGAGAVVVDAQERVLLIHRHRFIPDAWGWELPAGRIDPGESAIQAAVREVHEETGWTVRDPRHLCSLRTSPGLSDQHSHVILADADNHTGPSADADEADQIRWWTTDDVTDLLRRGLISDAFTLTGLLWYLRLGHRRQVPRGPVPLAGPLSRHGHLHCGCRDSPHSGAFAAWTGSNADLA